ncbi:MAG: hypothetical protein WAN30_09900 [Acidimicrobiales bacterium]
MNPSIDNDSVAFRGDDFPQPALDTAVAALVAPDAVDDHPLTPINGITTAIATTQ